MFDRLIIAPEHKDKKPRSFFRSVNMDFIKTPKRYHLEYTVRESVCEGNRDNRSILTDIIEASGLLEDKKDETKDCCFSLSPNEKSFQRLVDIARFTKEESETAVTLLKRAKDEGVIVEKFSNPPLYAFPHVIESREGYRRAQKANSENGKKGGRPRNDKSYITQGPNRCMEPDKVIEAEEAGF